MNIVLWGIQILLALAFASAGFMKVSQPIEALQKRMNYVKYTAPGIVRLIGVLEILGAIGLILPAATGILSWLTPVAATGLALTMVVASIVHVRLKEASYILGPGVLLILSLFIVVGRFLVVPLV